MNTTSKLQAKVNAVNAANKFANELQPALRAIFATFIGEKILKADGTLLAKVEKCLPTLPNTPRLSVFFNRSNYTLAWCVKTCEQIAGSATYHQETVYVGNLCDGILISLCDPVVLETDYTVNEVLHKRETAEKLKRQYEDAKNALHPFGE